MAAVAADKMKVGEPVLTRLSEKTSAAVHTGADVFCVSRVLSGWLLAGLENHSQLQVYPGAKPLLYRLTAEQVGHSQVLNRNTCTVKYSDLLVIVATDSIT